VAGDIVRVSRSAAFDCPAASVPGRTPVEVYFFEVRQNPAVLQLLRSVCVSETVAQDGYYDGLSSGSPQRIAYIVERGDLTGSQVIHWIDLTNGALSTSPFGFNPSVDNVSFAPSGNLALVRHGVAGTADYDLVDLCPGVLGTDLTPGASLDDLGAGVTGAITNVGGGLFDLVLNQGGSPLQTFADIADCLAAGPTDGACCLSDGTCQITEQSACTNVGGTWLGAGTACGDCPPPPATGACCIGQSCIPAVPQVDCENAGGTWQGAGSDCSACPMPEFTIAKTAAATAPAGGELTYTIAYQNIGDAAVGTVVQDFLPTGTTFIAASDGGALVEGEDGKVIERGELRMDPLRHAVTWKGLDVSLTVTEFLLLQALAQRPGFVKSRDQLMDVAYDDQVYVDDRTIDSHIKRLRKKLRMVDPEFSAIETLYGIGYRYNEE